MSHDNVIKVIIYLFVCRCCSSLLCACALAHWLFLLFSISRHFPCFSLRKRIARFALTQHVWKQQYMHSLSLFSCTVLLITIRGCCYCYYHIRLSLSVCMCVIFPRFFSLSLSTVFTIHSYCFVGFELVILSVVIVMFQLLLYRLVHLFVVASFRELFLLSILSYMTCLDIFHTYVLAAIAMMKIASGFVFVVVVVVRYCYKMLFIHWLWIADKSSGFDAISSFCCCFFKRKKERTLKIEDA